MNKTVLCLVVVFLTVLLGVCNTKVGYDFMNDASEISSVEIVELSEFDDERYEFFQTLLYEVSDTTTFIEEFSKIECRIHYTDPIQLSIGDIVIKIVYNNGDYELIGSDAQYKYRLNEVGSSYGFRELNEEQFEKTILKYLGE